MSSVTLQVPRGLYVEASNLIRLHRLPFNHANRDPAQGFVVYGSEARLEALSCAFEELCSQDRRNSRPLHRFTEPRQVIEVLRLAAKEPFLGEVPDRLYDTVVEAQDVGLVEGVSRARGRSRFTLIRLTEDGRSRLRRANDAAWRVAAGLSPEEG